MRISDMRAREPYDQIFRATLEEALRRLTGESIRVLSDSQGAQRWRLQPLLGGYFVEQPSLRVRRFLRDSFRHTPRLRRLVPQLLLGTALATSPGLRLTARPAFSLDRRLGGAEDVLIVPGNQRLRIFDFRRDLAFTLVKQGFALDSLRTEIRVRQTLAGAAFSVPLLDFSEEEGWFEEPIVECYNLARCPPWYPREQLATEATRILFRWQSQAAGEAKTEDYLRERVQKIRALGAEVAARFPAHRLAWRAGLVDDLAERVSEMPSIRVAPGHGDFQRGNVLVRKRDRRVFLIDWEHSAERPLLYDLLVWHLQSRSPRGLARRLRSFEAEGHPDAPALGDLGNRRERLQHLSLLGIEDLLWYLRESVTGPYQAPSAGLLLLLDELGSWSRLR